MKDLFVQFRDQSGSVKVNPHPGTWDRIEARLHAHRSERKLTKIRWFSLAAVMLCLVCAAATMILYAQWQKEYHSAQYSQSIEEFSTVTSSGESIYDVDRIRGYYALLGRTQ